MADADFVYDVEAQLQYGFNETVDVRVGYRVVGYVFGEDQDDELDFALAGWTAGVGFRF